MIEIAKATDDECKSIDYGWTNSRIDRKRKIEGVIKLIF